MLRVEHSDGVAVLRIEHGKVNAMDLELLTALRQTIGELAGHPLVLTGSASCFSAGVDLRRVVDGGATYTGEFLAELSAVFLATFRHRQPVVAAINGHALAGGCVLALAADLRVMSAGSMGLTELRVGVPFPTAAVEIVRYAVGPVASRLALTAAVFGPEQAEQLGLVHERCDPADLMGLAVARAQRLAGGRPEAYAATKGQLQADAERAIARDSPDNDVEVLRQWTSEGGRASIASFLDQLVAARETDR